MRIKALFLLMILALPAVAQQSRQDLENRKKQILEAIRETEDELAATKKDKNASMGQLRALQNKLAERQRLIGTINDEVSNISNNIQSSSTEVVYLRQNLELLKMRYAQSVRYSYENRSSYSMMAFLFSSSDFNDAIRRMKYLKKFRDYRETQVEQIRVAQNQLQHKIGVLNSEKAQKDELLTSQVQQKQVLEKETNETNQVVKDLKGREKELATNIEKNRKSAKQLDRAIGDIIKREIELARKKAEEEQRRKAEEERRNALNDYNGTHPPNKTSSSSIVVNNGKMPAKTTTTASPSYNLSLTPEVAALSNNFQANRGNLPWPVEKGFISERFGRHPHSVAEKVMVENDGIDIQTSANASARAVFDGTVSSVLYIPGMGQSVIINHGQFFTVYSRLTNVTVKKDQKVHIKQTLGTVILNDDNVPAVHFELWKVSGNSSAPVDPAGWIAK